MEYFTNGTSKTNIHRFATKMQILEGYDEGIRLSGRWTFQSLFMTLQSTYELGYTKR